jgi:hypothetical protein
MAREMSSVIQANWKKTDGVYPQLPPTSSPVQSNIFFLVSWGGVTLTPLGTSATNWPIVPAPDDR